LSQAQDWRKSLEYWLKPVPADESEAMIRDFLDDIPIIGDLFYRLAETVTIVLQIPVLALLTNGTSSAEVLICEHVYYQFTDFTTVQDFSTSYSTTIVPPSSGYIFVALLTVIAITFTVS